MTLIPFVAQVDRGEPLSRFEQMLFGRLGTLTIEQRNHHKFCMARFQYMDPQIEAIQEKLVEMHYGKDVEDWIAYFLIVIVICFRNHLIILSFIMLIFPI